MSSSAGSSVSGGSSVASDTSEARALADLSREGENDESVSDLLQQNKGVQEVVFGALYTLTKNRSAVSKRWTVLRVIVEFLQLFRIFFNTSFHWSINTELWIFKAFSWLLFRPLVVKSGYSTYVTVFYFLCVTILVQLALTVWATFMLRKESTERPWLRRLTTGLQFVALFLYGVFWLAIMDYMVYMFSCRWANIGSGGAFHTKFPEHNCLAMPHLAHMAFAGFMSVVLGFVTLCMSVADCELNPMTRNLLASPNASVFFKILGLKMIMVVVSTSLDTFSTIQPILMIIPAALIVYYVLESIPFYTQWLNHMWTGLYCGLLYTCALLLVLEQSSQVNDPAFRELMAMRVLYGIFPIVLAGAAASYVRMGFAKMPLKDLAKAFQDPDMKEHLRDAYRFKSREQVELLARVMRKWDEDGVPDPAAVAFGEFIIKAGMSRFPNTPLLLILHANYLIEVRKDVQGSRTQLQLAAKSAPGLFDRYFAHVSQELAKRMRSEGDGGMDLLGYVEFQRNFRACVKGHKLALASQRQFWHALLRDSVPFADLQRAIQVMEQSEKQASMIYKKVIERYPTSGRLIKIYGRFLEWVCNDPWAASRCYQEALRLGLTESMLGLGVGGSASGGEDASSRLVTLAGAVDEKVDGLVIMAADGVIMMVNMAGCRMFGYEKGELEGKNVSCLMPPPYSVQHNSYLARYAATGKSTLLDTQRQLVALRKDRSIFPVSIMATKLSGSGSDATFMAVIRGVKEEATSANGASSPVKAWCSATGIILCAEQRIADVLGMAAADLIGRPLSSLGSDIQALDKFLLGAVGLELGVYHNTQSKLLHKYLPPVEVELQIESLEQSLLCVSISNLSGAQDSLMVVDARGRICWANSQLGALLGYPLKTLQGLDLQAIIPPPFAQLHRHWMKDPASKPPPTSCRAPGSVVHMLSSNNTQVPVTLQMSNHDDGENVKHVVKVTIAHDSIRLDQRRLLLSLDSHGRVVSVNTGATKALFGFSPATLIGKHLSDFIDVLSQWDGKYKGDTSLLEMMVAHGQGRGGGSSFRVGVKAPTAPNRKAGAESGMSSILASINQGPKSKAAVMVLAPIIHSDDDYDGGFGAFGSAGAETGGSMPTRAAELEVQLWRADLLTAVIEVDRHLAISRADTAAGLVFGLSSKALLRKTVTSLMPMPGVHRPSDLLSSNEAGGAHKKGLMKSGAAWRIGPAKMLEAEHSNGGTPLKLQLQAVSKDAQQGSARLILRLQLLSPATATLEELEALLKEGAGGKSIRLNAANDSSDEEEEHPSGPQANGGSEGGDRAGTPDLHNRLDSRLRTKDWIATSFKNSELTAAANAAVADRDAADDGHAIITIGATGRGEQQASKVSAGMSDGTSDNGDNKSEGGASADAASEHSGLGGPASESEMSSMVAGDEDLTADWRRAKRLKKLNRMMTNSTAQAASQRYGFHTKILLAIMLLAHIACFAVLVIEIADRNENARNVQHMAYAVDKSQRIVLRTNYLQKCKLDLFKNYTACGEHQLSSYVEKLQHNIDILRAYHEGLYLGVDSLQPFKDPRLHEFWTATNPAKRIVESEYLELYTGNSTEQMQAVASNNYYISSNVSLWTMGNKFLSSADDVVFNFPIMGANLNYTQSWQYILTNGPASLFEGYSWSLDIFTDYCYMALLSLSSTMVVLLVVETGCVLLSCMLWEYVLAKLANAEHMRRFSVFLALPSATIRAMALKQSRVDDDDAADVDEDNDDNDDGAGAGAMSVAPDAGAASQAAKASKSVRMAGKHHDDDDDDDKPGAGRQLARQGTGAMNQVTHKRGSAGGARSALHNAAKHRRSAFGVLSKRVSESLLGWVQSKFKVNGKKLLPNDRAVTRIMVPLVLWALAVVVLYGVSFSSLNNLQGPLASLDAAAHVLYRSARVTQYMNRLALSETESSNVIYRAQLKIELESLEQDYTALLYGGQMKVLADVTFDTRAPPAAFANDEISDIFFKATRCLRADQTTCFKPTSLYYDVTHHGLNIMIVRFIAMARTFAAVPDELAWPDHPAFDYQRMVGANDMYDGLQRASELFVEYTVGKFNEVLQLHIILLVVTIAGLFAFIIMLFRPYTLHLRSDSKKIAGMLSQLPAEVDVESTVKSMVLGIAREEGRASMKAGLSSIKMIMPASSIGGNAADDASNGGGKGGRWA